MGRSGGTHLTSVPGEVEAKDGGAVVAQVLQGLQVLLQFPVGQLCLQEWRQAAEDKGVKGGWPGAQKPATGSRSLLLSPPKATQTHQPPPDPCASGDSKQLPLLRKALCFQPPR